MARGPFGGFFGRPSLKIPIYNLGTLPLPLKAAYFSQYSDLMTICIEQREFFCTPHTHCETGQFLCHFEQQLTLYKYRLHERVTWETSNVDRGEKYIFYITFGFKTIQAK